MTSTLLDCPLPQTLLTIGDEDDTKDNSFFKDQMKKFMNPEEQEDAAPPSTQHDTEEYVQAIPTLKQMSREDAASAGLSDFMVYTVLSSDAEEKVLEPCEQTFPVKIKPEPVDEEDDVVILENPKPLIKYDEPTKGSNSNMEVAVQVAKEISKELQRQFLETLLNPIDMHSLKRKVNDLHTADTHHCNCSGNKNMKLYFPHAGNVKIEKKSSSSSIPGQLKQKKAAMKMPQEKRVIATASDATNNMSTVCTVGECRKPGEYKAKFSDESVLRMTITKKPSRKNE